MSLPVVTVAMPVYNAGKYIREAIDSILNQAFSEFVFLIMNDGSTDDSESIILSYHDTRIQYYKNENNIGISKTLNKAIELTTTEYFARMDADDIALPERLKIQLEFLKSNPDIGVCGARYETFGNDTSVIQQYHESDLLKSTLLFVNQICHPTVIIRTEILKKNNIDYSIPIQFNDNFNHKVLELEDVFLWHKLKHITLFANVDKILLKYRVDGQNFSKQKEEIILERKKQYYQYQLKELKIVASDFNLKLHASLKYFTNKNSTIDIVEFKKHLNLIENSNNNLKIYNPESLKNILELRWNRFFYFLCPLGSNYVLKYFIVSKRIKISQLIFWLKSKKN